MEEKLKEIPVIESSIEIPDLSEFSNTQAKIEGWEIKEVKSFWNPETKQKIEEPILVNKLRIYTEVITHGKKDGRDFEIRASTLIPMKKNKFGEVGISSNPNSTIQKLFQKLRINKLSEIKDRFVDIFLDESRYLRIVI